MGAVQGPLVRWACDQPWRGWVLSFVSIWSLWQITEVLQRKDCLIPSWMALMWWWEDRVTLVIPSAFGACRVSFLCGITCLPIYCHRVPHLCIFFVNFLIFWMRLTTHLHKEINWIWDSETDPLHRLVLEGTPDFLFLPFRCRPSDWEADVGRQWALLLPYHHTRWCGGQEWRISGAACTW